MAIFDGWDVLGIEASTTIAERVDSRMKGGNWVGKVELDEERDAGDVVEELEMERMV